MAKARPSGEGRRISGGGVGKSQRAKPASAGKAKAKPQGPAARAAGGKPDAGGARASKAQASIVVRPEVSVRARRPMAPIVPVVPETPPPLPAPIASFTF